MTKNIRFCIDTLKIMITKSIMAFGKFYCSISTSTVQLIP